MDQIRGVEFSILGRGSNQQKGGHRMPLKTFALPYVASSPLSLKGIYHPTKIKVTLHPLCALSALRTLSDFESEHSDLYSRKINFLSIQANIRDIFLLAENATRRDIIFVFKSCFERKKNIESSYINESFVKEFHTNVKVKINPPKISPFLIFNFNYSMNFSITKKSIKKKNQILS